MTMTITSSLPPFPSLITMQTKNLCHEEKEEKRLGRIEAAFRKFDLDGDGYLRWVQILDMIVFHLNFIPIQRKIVFEHFINFTVHKPSLKTSISNDNESKFCIFYCGQILCDSADSTEASSEWHLWLNVKVCLIVDCDQNVGLLTSPDPLQMSYAHNIGWFMISPKVSGLNGTGLLTHKWLCSSWTQCVHLYFCFETGCPCKVSPIQPSWEEFQQIGLEEESARRIFHSSQQVSFPLVFDIWSIWFLVFPLMHQDKNFQIHLVFPWIDFSR